MLCRLTRLPPSATQVASAPSNDSVSVWKSYVQDSGGGAGGDGGGGTGAVQIWHVYGNASVHGTSSHSPEPLHPQRPHKFVPAALSCHSSTSSSVPSTRRTSMPNELPSVHVQG
eukprot:4608543-Prymnesium_polylepis.1